MKRSMRTRYTFHTADGEFIGWGDCPIWAAGVRRAWPGCIETQDRVMFLTDRPQGAVGRFDPTAPLSA